MDTYKSIVVLPFSNLSSDPENEYFADGVTEEIIIALSKIEGLMVTARTSSFAYKGKDLDIRHIGNELGVTMALEGSIRKSVNRVRISAQLVRTDNGFQVWSESFDRDLQDIFKLQDEISLFIAEKIRENFGHFEINEHLVVTATTNIEAYTLYLKGRYYQLRWNFDEFDIAIDHYKKSIALDPEFHRPYFGLLQCYGLKASWGAMDKQEGLEKANQYLIMGLKKNSHTSEAYFALATKALWVDWQPQEALRLLAEALAINPNDTEALESAAEAHIALGSFQEASTCIKKALQVNPLSANHHFTLGNIHYLQGHYNEALKWFRSSLDIDPSWEFSLQVSALCYIFQKDKARLDTLLQAHPQLKEGHLFPLLYQAINQGKTIDLESIGNSEDVYFPWSLWILIYAGHLDEALQYLIHQIEHKQGQYLNCLREPLNHPLTQNEAFQSKLPHLFDANASNNAETPRSSTHASLTEGDQRFYLEQLEKLMQEEGCYREENLSIRSLAQKLDLHPNKLSWLLNEKIGQNFNEYINGFRLKEFQAKALDEGYQHLSILGLAYECGFHSKSVFNDFFKKSLGLTPSAWLKAERKKQG